MSKDFYHFTLAIVTSHCMFVNNNKVSKILFTISAICWWLTFAFDITARIVNT